MSAREMLLEQANTRLQYQRDLLWNALEGLRAGDCFCEMAIGNPMYRDHSLACQKARHAVSVLRDDFVAALAGPVGSHGNQPLSGASGSAQSEAQKTPSHSMETYPDGTVRQRWELDEPRKAK